MKARSFFEVRTWHSLIDLVFESLVSRPVSSWNSRIALAPVIKPENPSKLPLMEAAMVSGSVD